MNDLVRDCVSECPCLGRNNDDRAPEEPRSVNKGRELSGLGISYEAGCY